MSSAPQPAVGSDYTEYRPHSGWDLLIERPPGPRPEGIGPGYVDPRRERYGDIVARLYPTGVLRLFDAAGNEQTVLSPSGWWAMRFAEQP